MLMSHAREHNRGRRGANPGAFLYRARWRGAVSSPVRARGRPRRTASGCESSNVLGSSSTRAGGGRGPAEAHDAAAPLAQEPPPSAPAAARALPRGAPSLCAARASRTSSAIAWSASTRRDRVKCAFIRGSFERRETRATEDAASIYRSRLASSSSSRARRARTDLRDDRRRASGREERVSGRSDDDAARASVP